jgi:hypothetical protein
LEFECPEFVQIQFTHGPQHFCDEEHEGLDDNLIGIAAAAKNGHHGIANPP